MGETIPVQIRWPKSLVAQVRAIAAGRHTTLSELTRQAMIDQFHLAPIDQISIYSDTEKSDAEKVHA